MKKFLTLILIVLALVTMFCACSKNDNGGARQDVVNQQNSANVLQQNQPTPTDVEYSLERYNLIRRTYWINGPREKANALPCEIEKPLGYVILFLEYSRI